MLPILEKMAEETKEKIRYGRVLTNKMTIVAWKLFQHDRNLHYGFILYRLRRDFGFKDWEISNLTGIPVTQIRHYITRMKPILDSEVLKFMQRLDFETEEEAFREIHANNGLPQGYYLKESNPFWAKKGYFRRGFTYAPPFFQLGGETEKEYEELLKKVQAQEKRKKKK